MAGRLTCCERLWSVKVEERSEIGNWMLLDTRDNDPPSLCGRLLCFCAPTYPRVPNAIKDIPEISMLAGAMLEDDWGLKGSVFTNRYMDFDKLNRVGNIKVCGGAEICNNCCASCGGHYQVAQWSAGDTSCVRYPLSVFGRCANFGYRYTFSSDWRKADIAITLNLCFCIPWSCRPGLPSRRASSSSIWSKPRSRRMGARGPGGAHSVRFAAGTA